SVTDNEGETNLLTYHVHGKRDRATNPTLDSFARHSFRPVAARQKRVDAVDVQLASIATDQSIAIPHLIHHCERLPAPRPDRCLVSLKVPERLAQGVSAEFLQHCAP